MLRASKFSVAYGTLCANSQKEKWPRGSPSATVKCTMGTGERRHTLLTPALRRQRKENLCEFQDNQVYNLLKKKNVYGNGKIYIYTFFSNQLCKIYFRDVVLETKALVFGWRNQLSIVSNLRPAWSGCQ